jgi:phage-related protein
MPALTSILSAILPLIPIILNSLMPVVVLLAEAFGMLMPQIATVIGLLVGALAPVITSLIGVITPVIQIVVELVSSFAQMLIPIIMVVVEVFMILMPIIAGIITIFADIATVIFSVVGPALSFVAQIFTFIARFITGVFVAAIRLLLPILSGVFSGISIGVKAMQDGFKWAMNQMIGFAEGFINFFVDGFNWIFSLLNKLKIDIPEVLRPLVGGMKSIGFNIQPMQKIRLPRLAEGGTVYPSEGGSIVNVAEAGRPERIEPLDANGLSKRDIAMIRELSGNGMQITVNAGPGMDERELAEVVSRRLAFEMRKGTI